MRLLNPCFWARVTHRCLKNNLCLIFFEKKVILHTQWYFKNKPVSPEHSIPGTGMDHCVQLSGRYQGSLGLSSPFDLVNGSLVYSELTARLTHYFVFVKLKNDISLFLPVFSTPIKALTYFLDVHILLLPHLQYLGLHFSMTPIVY